MMNDRSASWLIQPVYLFGYRTCVAC